MTFPTTHPIVASAMNQVSDAKFAVHCYNVGIMPSISIYNYVYENLLDYKIFENELKLFYNNTNSNIYFLSCSAEHILDDNIIEIITKYDVKYFEFIEGLDKIDKSVFYQKLKKMQAVGCKFFVKILNSEYTSRLNIFDGVIIKGRESAGRSDASISLKENFQQIRKKFPKLLTIPSGGISTKEHVDYYISRGAYAVSIGTLFVASEECSVSISFKEELIKNNSLNLTRIETDNSNFQQVLHFGILENDDTNHTYSLSSKIQGSSNGIIFAGTAIDIIDSISPLAKIVSLLVE